MTNKEYMINLLLDGLESIGGHLTRVQFDDNDGTEEAMIYYNISCPYHVGDERAYCRKNSLESSRELCTDCKTHWLEQEVDE